MTLYLGLVHHPIRNKIGELVTTSVTNLDIHDIARSCRTFGAKRYFIITPLLAQQGLVNRILGHWETDDGAAYNPDRSDALALAQVVSSIEDAEAEITTKHGQRPKIVVTGANFEGDLMHPSELREKLSIDEVPYFLLFGTGWGLYTSVLERSDYQLTPILGQAVDGYNHLSVRSAVAIYLDKLLGVSVNP
jgi:hypothetical protein